MTGNQYFKECQLTLKLRKYHQKLRNKIPGFLTNNNSLF